jgi:hypothetical protein
VAGTTGPDKPGWVRLLEKESTKAERYAHAAALMAILERQRKADVAAVR